MRTMLVSLTSLCLFACSTEPHGDPDISQPETETDSTPSCEAPSPSDFVDHTQLTLPHMDCLAEGELLKFTISSFQNDSEKARIHFYDGDFYRLHDEWYIFRLLNGVAIEGLNIAPFSGGPTFETIAAIYDHFATSPALPLNLSRLSANAMWPERIYAPRFYDLAGLMNSPVPRFFGLGSLYRFGAQPGRTFPDAFWAFDLEYSDAPDLNTLIRFFDHLEAKLPRDLKGRLYFLARSPTQRALVEQFKDLGHPLAPRLLTYDALSMPGELVIYNEGITAGRLQRLEPGFSPSEVRSDAIAILPEVPDDLSPSRAILSAVPQSALSHLNLLAQARGTPNAYLGGVMGRVDLRDFAYLETPVLLSLEGENLHLQVISAEALQTYETRLHPAPPTLANVDWQALTLSTPLESLSPIEARALSAGFGGKSSGLALLYAHQQLTPGELPPQALGISIRPYMAHLEPLRASIAEVLAHPEFQTDARLRHLILEGPESFEDAYGQLGSALALLRRTLERDNILGDIARQGGIQGMIMQAPLDAETHAELRTLLRQHFAALSPLQGLRFRSSSTAEDLPGFHGAGLYDSNTGFLFPSQLSSPSDKARTIEAAIKKTWASYWGFYAYEERERVGIDHFQAGMGLTVHARFDDPLERFNAVATLQLNHYESRPHSTLTLQLRPGALAVTNPGGGTSGLETLVIQREHPTAPPVVTGFDPSESLLTEAELLRLFEAAEAQAQHHLALEQAQAAEGEGLQSLTLDFELKGLFAGWPAQADGSTLPARIIWRQARPLEGLPRLSVDAPSPLHPEEALLSGLPRDLLPLLSSLSVTHCQSEALSLTTFEAYTERNATAAPFADSPLLYRARIAFASPSSVHQLPWSQLTAGPNASWGTPSLNEHGLSAFRLQGDPTSPTLHLLRDGVWAEVPCLGFERFTPYESPERFLRSLLR